MNLSNIFEDKIILVTGGTGSIGTEIVSQLLKYDPKTVRILSNSENELWESQLRFKNSITKLRFLLGDIRDFERIKRATQNVDYIFNAASIKYVPISEYNPMEAIDVNIHGLENIIEASIVNKVKKLIHLSTDKAVTPTTVMGATEMLGERLCISRELAKGESSTIISSVRFGNLLGSRGSIVPLIKEQINNGNYVTLTDQNMRRFFMSISQAVELVLKSAVIAQGGEIFVLKMPTILIKDLFEAVIEEYCAIVGKDPSSIKIKTIGPRLGEKLNEELISPVEYPYCYEIDDMYIIYPPRYFENKNLLEKIIKNGIKFNFVKKAGYNTEDQKPLSKYEIKKFIQHSNLL